MNNTEDISNGRTHEPSLKEITAELDGFRELMKERDRRYEERFKAQETAVVSALAAQKELTSNAFRDSEKAIQKAENAQNAYNQFHNDLTRKMEAKDKEYINSQRFDDFKKEYETYKTNQFNEITNLRLSKSQSEGKSSGLNTGWIILGQIISIVASIIAIFIAIK